MTYPKTRCPICGGVGNEYKGEAKLPHLLLLEVRLKGPLLHVDCEMKGVFGHADRIRRGHKLNAHYVTRRGYRWGIRHEKTPRSGLR